MSICSRRRIKSPNGTWGYEALIGAQVKVRSTAITNFFGSFCAGDTYTIKDIYFQCSLDGKVITLIELAELEGKFFTWKDLEVIEIGDAQLTNAICGVFNAGESQVGRNVSHDPTWLEDIKNGIAIIDANGNIIVNRYIRLTQATVEDVEVSDSGDSNITDITFCGDIIK